MKTLLWIVLIVVVSLLVNLGVVLMLTQIISAVQYTPELADIPAAGFMPLVNNPVIRTLAVLLLALLALFIHSLLIGLTADVINAVLNAEDVDHE